MLTKLPKSFKSPAPSSGFTLIEVLASVAISLVIFSLAGWASANLLQNKYKTSADSEVRNSLNRATEFIADEVRQAKQIIKDEYNIKKDDLPEYTADDQVVLALVHPRYIDKQIIYYTTPPRNDWEIGPRVLRRWGPPLAPNGNYQEDEVDWVDAPIVDRLAAKGADADDNLARCGALNPVPAAADQADGFFVCVSNGQDLVRLRLNAQVNLTSSTGGQKDKVIYTTDTKSFARLAESAPDEPGPNLPPPPPPPIGGFPPYEQFDLTRPNVPFAVKVSNPRSLEIKRDAEFIATYPPVDNKTTDCSACTIKVGENSYSLSNNPLMEGKNPDQVTLEVTLNEKTFRSIDGNNNTIGQSVEFWEYHDNPYDDVPMENNQVLVVFRAEGQEFFILLSFRDKIPA